MASPILKTTMNLLIQHGNLSFQDIREIFLRFGTINNTLSRHLTDVLTHHICKNLTEFKSSAKKE